MIQQTYICMQMELQKGEVDLEVYADQVSGKEPKLLTTDNAKILKGFNLNEYQFYQSVSKITEPPTVQKLRVFLPTFYGKYELDRVPKLVIKGQTQCAWLNHLAARYKTRNQSNTFIILQNLTKDHEQPNIFDIKIGGRNVEGKKHKITKSVSNYFIKLNGCRIANFDGKSKLFTKYFLGEITEFDAMAQYIALYFAVGQIIQKTTIQLIMAALKELITIFREVRGFRFISSSLCLIYDMENPSKVDLRLLDFGRVVKEDDHFMDEDSLTGMESVVSLLNYVIQNIKHFENHLSKLRQKCNNSEVSHIPSHKLIKEEGKQQKQAQA